MQFSSVLLFAWISIVSSLKFEMAALQPQHQRSRCIKNYVGADTLVVVTAFVGGHHGDGQRVDIEITDSLGNQYGKPRNVVGESRSAFTVHENAQLSICFYNTDENVQIAGKARSIELDVDIGADAMDWSAIQKAEKLKPMELELRRLESLIGEVVGEMDYLKSREQRMRDTNESTNERVKGFAILSLIVLAASGTWQVIYLRSFFQRKKLI